MAKAIEWSDLEVIKILGEVQAGKVWLARLKHPFEQAPSRRVSACPAARLPRVGCEIVVDIVRDE